ncbi:MAG TPA: serine hydrolase [Gammaproteobacteria bacterium]|nr:serine hydrolase [Gammaproteobacteria bacterium]
MCAQSSYSDNPSGSRSMIDSSRRSFLAGFGALFAAAFGLASPSSEAARPRYQTSNNALLRDFRTPYHIPRMNTLATDIDIYIKKLRRAGRIKGNERTAWLIYDFTTRQYLVAINATRSHQSASMVKPFIALAFFHKVREGKLQYTSFHRSRMEAMIQRSDNSATNYFIQLLNRTSRRSGPAEAERTLKRYHPDIFRHTRIVERIPGGGRTYRNKASALDYHRFLYALWYNRLPYSAELKRLMNLPNRDRVYSDAHGVARQTWVIDKTGTTARLCGDMGILIAQGRNGYRYPYTFVGIIEKSRSAGNYKAWKDDRGDVIREVSSLAYAHLQRMHNLV